MAGFADPSMAGVTPQTIEAKIPPQVLPATAAGGNAAAVILLADQADVSAAHAIKDQDARGW